MKLYCDMNIYNRCFDDQSQIRIRLETTAIEAIFDRVEAEEFSLHWSFMLEHENRLNPYQERRQGVKLLRRICRDNIIIPSVRIKDLAEKVVDDLAVKPRDALHLACAEVAPCDYFITCDDRIIHLVQRQKSGLKLAVRPVNPIDFVKEVITSAETEI